MQAATSVNPRVSEGNTSQGRYVFGPDGSAYGFNNNRSVERVLALMERGLERNQVAGRGSQVAGRGSQVAGGQSQVAGSGISDLRPQTRDQSRPEPPPGTTILRLYSRIKPTPADCDPGNQNLQRDYFWILAEESRSLVTEHAVPKTFAMRLCRFALVDAVRGEPDYWKQDEVRSAEFKVIQQPSGKLRVTGRFEMSTANRSRGLRGTLEAEVQAAGEAITSFRGFVDGTAWGEGTYTPGAPTGEFPIKFVMILAPKSLDTVAPQAAMYGREYLSP